MKYIAAIPIFAILVALDVLMLISFVGILALLACNKPYPMSYAFISKV